MCVDEKKQKKKIIKNKKKQYWNLASEKNIILNVVNRVWAVCFSQIMKPLSSHIFEFTFVALKKLIIILTKVIVV